MPVPASLLDEWHRREAALERLRPPWERVRVVDAGQGIRDGSRVILELAWGPARVRWVAEHFDCRPGEGFSDRQLEGPFAAWEHRHEFRDLGDGKSELVDRVRYALPGGVAGAVAAGGAVRRRLERTFAYRHAVTRADLERSPGSQEASPQTVVVTGATGLIGEALGVYLRLQGNRVVRVTRSPRNERDLFWDPVAGTLDLRSAGHVDSVVHLAGENIAGGRWTQAKKTAIRKSRRMGTRTVVRALAQCPEPRPALLSVSGVNYYRAAPGTVHDEESESGEDFLAEVCRIWEGEALAAAEEEGIRVVILRLGMVLSPAGGALGKMLPVFRMGAGGPFGSGAQRTPWVVVDDVVDIMHRALVDATWSGVFNAVGPEIVSNRRFTEVLGQVLGRPVWMPVPAAAIRALFGEMGEATLLADLGVRPARLEERGYPFRYPRLEEGLRFLLGREG
ncbi:MAG TPA: TIGR01777 family oxidoreductase [Verrucomicrobiales bacterium]|nr:TIGR01777 family oxidoreductase [Verrucomicrobiales bacterium]